MEQSFISGVIKMANEVKMKMGMLEASIFAAVNKGATLKERVDNRKMATVAILVWCGTMSLIGSIMLAINDVGLVFTGVLIGGGLIIIALFIDVTDLYLVWSIPKDKEPTDVEKGLNASFGDD